MPHDNEDLRDELEDRTLFAVYRLTRVPTRREETTLT